MKVAIDCDVLVSAARVGSNARARAALVLTLLEQKHESNAVAQAWEPGSDDRDCLGPTVSITYP